MVLLRVTFSFFLFVPITLISGNLKRKDGQSEKIKSNHKLLYIFFSFLTDFEGITLFNYNNFFIGPSKHSCRILGTKL